ncbi:hypothetical protein NC652_027104 [Populus alba x Populus x berolinensis]|nr:hypothetical protein NC652_027104 [Populus alba x Populus x berolinensis]
MEVTNGSAGGEIATKQHGNDVIGDCASFLQQLHIDQHQSWASFTSRGPNAIHPSILKLRDVNILAAWSGATAPSKLYEVIAIWLTWMKNISGISHSRSIWQRCELHSKFGFRALPSSAKAADHGLVYDASYTDYVLYLCSYGDKNVYPQIQVCRLVSPSIYNFNYHISVTFLSSVASLKTSTRTVSNVGC